MPVRVGRMWPTHFHIPRPVKSLYDERIWPDPSSSLSFVVGQQLLTLARESRNGSDLEIERATPGASLAHATHSAAWLQGFSGDMRLTGKPPNCRALPRAGQYARARPGEQTSRVPYAGLDTTTTSVPLADLTACGDP